MSSKRSMQIVAYESRRPHEVFIPVPHVRGLYRRVHACVAFVRCPHCGSAAGELCVGKNHGRTEGRAEVHYKRRNVYAEARRKGIKMEAGVAL